MSKLRERLAEIIEPIEVVAYPLTWLEHQEDDIDQLIALFEETHSKQIDALLLQLDRVIDSYSIHQPKGWPKGTVARRGMKNKVRKAVRHFTKPDYAVPNNLTKGSV